MMTAAMRVLPSPVGKQTKVFCSSAVLMMSIWYALSGTEAGYTQCFALDLQHNRRGSVRCQKPANHSVDKMRQ